MTDKDKELQRLRKALAFAKKSDLKKVIEYIAEMIRNIENSTTIEL